MNKETRNAALAIAAAAVILIPVIQCWLISQENASLQRQIRETRETNRRLQRDVGLAYETKTSELLQTSEQIDVLEDRLLKNERLSDETEEAQQKLAAVKDLIEEHRRISQELDQWKRMFPELFSGR